MDHYVKIEKCRIEEQAESWKSNKYNKGMEKDNDTPILE